MKKLLPLIFLSLIVHGWAQIVPQYIGSVDVGQNENQLSFTLLGETGGHFPSPGVAFFTDHGSLAILDRFSVLKIFRPPMMAFEKSISLDPQYQYTRLDPACGDGNIVFLHGDPVAFFLDPRLMVKKRVRIDQVHGDYLVGGDLWFLRPSDDFTTAFDLDGNELDPDQLLDTIRHMNKLIYSGQLYPANIRQQIQQLIESGTYLFRNGAIYPRNWKQAETYYRLFDKTPWRSTSMNQSLPSNLPWPGPIDRPLQVSIDGTSVWGFRQGRNLYLFSPWGDLLAVIDYQSVDPEDIAASQGQVWDGYSPPVTKLLDHQGDVYIMAPDPQQVKFYVTKRPYLSIDLISLAKAGAPIDNPDAVAGTIAQISPADLRILRNAIFALHGYVFQSEDLKVYFNKFDWYHPDPAVKSDRSILTDNEKRLLDLISVEEERRS